MQVSDLQHSSAHWRISVACWSAACWTLSRACGFIAPPGHDPTRFSFSFQGFPSHDGIVGVSSGGGICCMLLLSVMPSERRGALCSLPSKDLLPKAWILKAIIKRARTSGNPSRGLAVILSLLFLPPPPLVIMSSSQRRTVCVTSTSPRLVIFLQMPLRRVGEVLRN